MQLVIDNVEPTYATEFVLLDLSNGSFKPISGIEIQSPGFILKRGAQVIPSFLGENVTRNINTIKGYRLPKHVFQLADRYFKTHASHFGHDKNNFLTWLGIKQPIMCSSTKARIVAARRTWEKLAKMRCSDWKLDVRSDISLNELSRDKGDSFPSLLLEDEPALKMDDRLTKAAGIALYSEFYIIPTAGASVVLEDKNGTAGAWICIRSAELAQRSNDAINALPSVLMKLTRYLDIAGAFKSSGLVSDVESNEKIAAIAVNLCSQPDKNELVSLKNDIVKLVHKFSCGDEHTTILDYAYNKISACKAWTKINRDRLTKDPIVATSAEIIMMEEVAASSF